MESTISQKDKIEAVLISTAVQIQLFEPFSNENFSKNAVNGNCAPWPSPAPVHSKLQYGIAMWKLLLDREG
jgi:hypothetical protein